MFPHPTLPTSNQYPCHGNDLHKVAVGTDKRTLLISGPFIHRYKNNTKTSESQKSVMPICNHGNNYNMHLNPQELSVTSYYFGKFLPCHCILSIGLDKLPVGRNAQDAGELRRTHRRHQ